MARNFHPLIMLLARATQAEMAQMIDYNGGMLTAANGVSLGQGQNLVGVGAVNGAVAAGIGSTIDATGNLTLGDATSYDGFFSDGRLNLYNNTVTLNDKNAAVLGSLTQIDGGTLKAANGFLLENGKNLISSSAGGAVSKGLGPDISRFLNRGYVEGPSASSGNWLIFDLLFKGSTGQTAGNIGFLGGYSPGDSPGVNNHQKRLRILSASSTPVSEYTPLECGKSGGKVGLLNFDKTPLVQVRDQGVFNPSTSREHAGPCATIADAVVRDRSGHRQAFFWPL
jgi:hypothetical protein